jgi:hypothetical protein
MEGRSSIHCIRTVIIPLTCAWLAACGSNPPAPSAQPVPVRVIVAGEPFTANVAGQVVSADNGVDVEYQPGAHEVSGTFSGELMIVAFGKGTAAGGVLIGSLQILEGPGSLPTGYAPFQDGCVAVWGGQGPRPQAFRVRFTVTTDASRACIPERTDLR